MVEIMRTAVLALGILLGASALGWVPLLVRYQKLIRALVITGVTLLVLGEPAWRGWQQYLAWNNAEATRLLLTENPTYIYSYSFVRFALWRWVAGVVAVALYWLAVKFVVVPSQGMRMNRDEALLVAFGVAIAGMPVFIIYLLGVFLLYTLILAFLQFRVVSRRHSRRFASTGESDSPPRFPIALPATLALLLIPIGQSLYLDLAATLGFDPFTFQVTNLSL